MRAVVTLSVAMMTTKSVEGLLRSGNSACIWLFTIMQQVDEKGIINIPSIWQKGNDDRLVTFIQLERGGARIYLLAV